MRSVRLFRSAARVKHSWLGYKSPRSMSIAWCPFDDAPKHILMSEGRNLPRANINKSEACSYDAISIDRGTL